MSERTNVDTLDNLDVEYEPSLPPELRFDTPDPEPLIWCDADHIDDGGVPDTELDVSMTQIDKDAAVAKLAQEWLSEQNPERPMTSSSPTESLGENHDTIIDHTQDVHEIVAHKMQEEQLRSFLMTLYRNETLTARELVVLGLHFGLSGVTVQTLDEIGQILDTTRERVRQIEKKALEKIGMRAIRTNYKGGGDPIFRNSIFAAPDTGSLGGNLRQQDQAVERTNEQLAHRIRRGYSNSSKLGTEYVLPTKISHKRIK
jgi:Sigma-70, region 4